jgi:putative membrane protein
MVALVLGILNAFIRPVIMFLALPLLLVTLGLFMLVINASLLYLVGLILGDHFEVHGFGAAVLGALIISIVSTILNVLTGTNRAVVKVQRPRKRDDHDDVIDI